MPIDPGLGGGGGYAPVPVDPILGGQRPYIPPVYAPQTPVVDITSNTEWGAIPYRGYYYELGESRAGGWIWFIYAPAPDIHTNAAVPIGGGTEPSQAEAMQQITGIIDGLTDDPEYVAPPIAEDFDLGIDVPTFGDSYLGMFDSAVVPIDSVLIGGVGNGNGGGGNGNGNGNGEPWFENFELVGLVAIIAAVMMLKRQVK
jgi:hypothetical protein